MANNIQISIDQASQKHLNQQFELLKSGTERSLYSALAKVLMKIKTESQLRLTGKGHIVTSRLKNSIYVKMKKPLELPASSGQLGGNSKTYADKDGQTFSSELRSVSVGDLEGAVGTNVEYADKIETLDSFLYWGMKNVDITKSVGDDMTNDLKFGKFLKPGVTK